MWLNVTHSRMQKLVQMIIAFDAIITKHRKFRRRKRKLDHIEFTFFFVVSLIKVLICFTILLFHSKEFFSDVLKVENEASEEWMRFFHYSLKMKPQKPIRWEFNNFNFPGSTSQLKWTLNIFFSCFFAFFSSPSPQWYSLFVRAVCVFLSHQVRATKRENISVNNIKTTLVDSKNTKIP